MQLQYHRRILLCGVLLAFIVPRCKASSDCISIKYDCSSTAFDDPGVIIIIVLILVLKLVFIAAWLWWRRRRRIQEENTRALNVPTSPGSDQLQTVTATVPQGYPSSSNQYHSNTMHDPQTSYISVAMPDNIKLIESDA